MAQITELTCKLEHMHRVKQVLQKEKEDLEINLAETKEMLDNVLKVMKDEDMQNQQEQDEKED